MEFKKANKILPARLAVARNNMNLKQSDLAMRLSEIAVTDKPINPMTISFWETGSREVPEKYESALALALETDIKWLKGMETEAEYNEVEIPFPELYRYDGCPVWVEFERKEMKNAWGLYNHEKRRIIFTTYSLSMQNVVPGIHFYEESPNAKNDSSKIRKASLSFDNMLNAKAVYVKMNTHNKEICGMYNGWYRHNEMHSALIKENGLILPYSGLGISYIAYTSPY